MKEIEIIQKNGKCCSCEGSLAEGMHILALPFRADWNHPIWRIKAIKGKLAAAVVCSKCLSKKPKFVIEWDKKTLEIKYHPIEDLEDLSEVIGKKFGKGAQHGR
jgi:hypothetical protein